MEKGKQIQYSTQTDSSANFNRIIKTLKGDIFFFPVFRIFFILNLVLLYDWIVVLSNEIHWFGTQNESVLYISIT